MRRVNRWDTRFLLGILRLFGRRVFRLLVCEEGGQVVGTTLLTFPSPSVYLSMVVVDPSVRRRGFAQALLAEARATGLRMRRRYLVLDVLANNAPARALYEGKLGYRPLREVSFMARERPADVGAARTTLPSGLRPFRRADSGPLVAIRRGHVPPEVEQVVPTPAHLMAGNRTGDRILGSESSAWVVDRGHGPEAFVMATFSQGVEAAHLSDPIVADSADPTLARELIRVALAWCGGRGAVRAVVSVPRYDRSGRAVLEAEGFHDALSIWTLSRPVA
jgi:hypothetical protein